MLTHDARFMMFKPSLAYAAVGVAMLERGWLVRYMPERVRDHVPEDDLAACGRAWAALMLGTAALNAAFALRGDLATWSVFVTVFPTASKVGLFAGQYALLRRTVMRARQSAAA
jgi:hypothetical protein